MSSAVLLVILVGCGGKDTPVSAPALEKGVYAEDQDDRPELNSLDALEPKVYLAEHAAELNAIPKNALTFSRACEVGTHLTLAAVGDVLLHSPLAIQGMKSADGFRSLWKGVAKNLTAGDLTYANMEGPTAGNVSSAGYIVPDPGLHFDKVAYSSYPSFNYHPSLVPDLKASGLDVVSTANNHAMDRRSIGADRTIKDLLDTGLQFTGTRTAQEARMKTPAQSDWYTITKHENFTIAWVACAFSTNGNPDPKKQVLLCYEQRDILLAQVAKLHADKSIDAVIVTPHWGVEYQLAPETQQQKLAKQLIEAGALIVFGGHPHVLEPVDKITASDGHEGYVIYSLGNFVSGQKGVAKRTSAIIYVGLTKNVAGETFVNGARHLPIFMDYTGGLSARPSAGAWEESRQFANHILGRSMEIGPNEPVITNPECI